MNLSEGVWADGYEAGVDNRCARNVSNLMESLGITAGRAMDLLEVPAADRERISKLVAEMW